MRNNSSRFKTKRNKAAEAQTSSSNLCTETTHTKHHPNTWSLPTIHRTPPSSPPFKIPAAAQGRIHSNHSSTANENPADPEYIAPSTALEKISLRNEKTWGRRTSIPGVTSISPDQGPVWRLLRASGSLGSARRWVETTRRPWRTISGGGEKSLGTMSSATDGSYWSVTRGVKAVAEGPKGSSERLLFAALLAPHANCCCCCCWLWWYVSAAWSSCVKHKAWRAAVVTATLLLENNRHAIWERLPPREKPTPTPIRTFHYELPGHTWHFRVSTHD